MMRGRLIKKKKYEIVLCNNMYAAKSTKLRKSSSSLYENENHVLTQYEHSFFLLLLNGE